MDVRPTWTDCDEARDYVVPNVFSPRDLVSRPDNMDETVSHIMQDTLTGFVRRTAEKCAISICRTPASREFCILSVEVYVLSAL